MKTESAFGAFLDPVADKLMVAAALILLSASPPASLTSLRAPLWLVASPAVAIIGREITMSALREWAASAGGGARSAVAVNSLGKWKTATQMAGIAALLAADPTAAALGAAGGAAGAALARAGVALVWASAGLALTSLGVYMRALVPFFFI
jgi:CDP-diacylglycerol--glycerol-3-phosphate 3-phosphatidyltransferase